MVEVLEHFAPPARLRVLELGLTPYEEALGLQRRLAQERSRGLIPDTLLLLEHPHVVTLGRGFNGRTLAGTVHPVLEAERGGDATYHGPGQLVGYPIVHLKERGLLIGPYLRLLEEVLIDASAAFGIRAERLRGFTGVWAGGKKLASIGVAVRGWVAYHGFALNVTTDLSQFDGIYPCGLEPGTMTSMERLLGRTPEMLEVRGRVRACIERALPPASRQPGP